MWIKSDLDFKVTFLKKHFLKTASCLFKRSIKLYEVLDVFSLYIYTIYLLVILKSEWQIKLH